MVEDARLGDLRPAQDPGPARHRLRQGDLRVRLPAGGAGADQPGPQRRQVDPALRRRHGDVRDRTRGAGGDAAGPLRRPPDPAHAGARLLVGGAGAGRLHLAAGLRQRVGLPRHLPPQADRRARGRQRQRQRQRQGRRPADLRRLPRHGRPRPHLDHLEQGRGAAGRRPRRVAAGRDRVRPRAGRGAAQPSRRRPAAGADRARLLPPAADLQAGRLRAREAAARGEGQPRLGLGAGAGAPRHRRARRRARGRGCRLPLRRRPVGAATAVTCAARSRTST